MQSDYQNTVLFRCIHIVLLVASEAWKKVTMNTIPLFLSSFSLTMPAKLWQSISNITTLSGTSAVAAIARRQTT